MRYITVEELREKGACASALQRFLSVYPEGKCPATVESLRLMAGDGWAVVYYNWVWHRLLTEEEREGYLEEYTLVTHYGNRAETCPGCISRMHIVEEILNAQHRKAPMDDRVEDQQTDAGV